MKQKYIIMVLFLIFCGCKDRKRRVEAVSVNNNELPPVNKILIDFNEMLIAIMSTIAIIIAIVNVIRYEIQKFRIKSRFNDLERQLQHYQGTIPNIDYYRSNGKLMKRTTYKNINGSTNRPLFDVEEYEDDVNDLTKLKNNEIDRVIIGGSNSNNNVG